MITSTRLEEQGTGIFELSRLRTDISNGHKTETILSKDGVIYAKHVYFVHDWDGIQYIDGGAVWRCPDSEAKTASKDDPTPQYERWVPAQLAVFALIDLIFKQKPGSGL